MASAMLLWLFSVVEQMLYQISLNQEELKWQYRNLFKEVKELKDLRAKEDVPGEIPEDIHLPLETMESGLHGGENQGPSDGKMPGENIYSAHL